MIFVEIVLTLGVLFGLTIASSFVTMRRYRTALRKASKCSTHKGDAGPMPGCEICAALAVQAIYRNPFDLYEGA